MSLEGRRHTTHTVGSLKKDGENEGKKERRGEKEKRKKNLNLIKPLGLPWRSSG